MPNLCVNIDHIATLREARKDIEPDPIYGAVIVELAGANGITVHLREDRRHIQDRDVFLLRKIVKTKLNLEMSINPDIVKTALNVKPDEATIVPEKRQEITTEGGLDVIKNKTKIEKIIKKLKKKGIVVSLFIDPDLKQIKEAKKIGADFVEIHTGMYANAKTEKDIIYELDKIKKSVKFAKELGLRVNAGHGLTYRNVKEIAKMKDIEDLNIGHNIIARSVLVGLEKAVKEMIEIIKNAQ